MIRLLVILSLVLLPSVDARSIDADCIVNEKTICLNMIVKDESHVIRRCLESVKPLIDYWVIVDTGSTDDTMAVIAEVMEGIPGELYQSPWVNFGHNRSEALDLADSRADYLLFIDADEELIIEESLDKGQLSKDCYCIITHYGGVRYPRMQLVKTGLDWRWVGPVHEALESPRAKSAGELAGMYNFVRPEGASWRDPDKYVKHAMLLEDALEQDPGNRRYTFYLAQSYRDAGMLDRAIETYRKRALQGGWHEEVFYSLYQIGLLQERLGEPPELFLASYERARRAAPYRKEALYHLVNYYRRDGQYEQALALIAAAPKRAAQSSLFHEQWITSWGLPLEEALCHLQLGHHEVALRIYEKVLESDELPQFIVDYIHQTLPYCLVVN